MISKKPVGADKPPILLLPAPVVSAPDKKGKPGIGVGGCVPPPPILPQPPQYSALNADQIAQISGKGGAGISGHGILQGTVAYKNQGLFVLPALETSPGVHFNINGDQRAIQQFVGQTVQVEGNIDKDTDTVGRISAAKITKAPSVGIGSFVTLKGNVVEILASMTPGGKPSGPYLALDNPVVIDGKSHSTIFLGYGELGAETRNREFHGQISKTQNADTVRLAGISDPAAGEPSFNGSNFTTVAGKPAARLLLDQQSQFDGNDVILVLDQGADKAFEGAFSSGMRVASGPSFQGFNKKTFAIESATAADRAAIKTDVTRGVETADGRKLPIMAQTAGSGANPRTTLWAYDKTNDTAYRVHSQGGIAGFTGTVDQVIRGLSQTRVGPGGQ